MQIMGMPLSANISIMFTEKQMLERPAAAREAGFTHIESWWPFISPDPNEGAVEEFISAVHQADIALDALNLYAGDMAGGERGIASVPDRRHELEESVVHVIRIAQKTGCKKFNLLYGQRSERWDPGVQDAAAIESIKFAATLIAQVEGTILLEPLAAGLNGTYPLQTPEDAVSLIKGPLAAHENVGLLFDLFHLTSNGVNTVQAAADHAQSIAHVQLADSPGRGEPGTGSAPLRESLVALREIGYKGAIGCEYKPSSGTESSLNWINDFR